MKTPDTPRLHNKVNLERLKELRNLMNNRVPVIGYPVDSDINIKPNDKPFICTLGHSPSDIERNEFKVKVFLKIYRNDQCKKFKVYANTVEKVEEHELQ